MKNLQPKEAAELIKLDKSLRIIDVRENWEYEIVHLPQSELMPLSNFQNHIVNLKKEDVLLVYCHHGVRSASICNYLKSNGFNNVINLAGGINAWASDIDSNMLTY
jgi:adenylyltransferase/sulfurtransferase